LKKAGAASRCPFFFVALAARFPVIPLSKSTGEKYDALGTQTARAGRGLDDIVGRLPQFVELKALQRALRGQPEAKGVYWTKTGTGSSPHAFYPYEPYLFIDQYRERVFRWKQWHGIPYPGSEEETQYLRLAPTV